jgi:hypothetical protein
MRRTFILPAVGLLAVAIGLLAASSAVAQGVYVYKYRGYGPAVVPVYPYGYIAPYYGYPYNARKAYRQGLRYGYPPLFQAWPLPPAPTYMYPYYGALPYYAPPVGPRDYMYQPPEARPMPSPRLQEPLPEPMPAPQPAEPLESIPAPAGN